MSVHRGFTLFEGGQITSNLGSTFNIRGNTASENAQIKAWIDLLLDTPSIRIAFQAFATAGGVTIRSIPVIAEFPV